MSVKKPDYIQKEYPPDHAFRRDELGNLTDVAKALGVPDHLSSRVRNWAVYRIDFPYPIWTFGHTDVYVIADVIDWVKLKGVKAERFNGLA